MDKEPSKFFKSRIIIYISVLFNFAFIVLLLFYVKKHGGIDYIKKKIYPPQNVEQPAPKRAYFYNLLESFYKEELTPENGNILFLGDSHFAIIPWREYLSDNMIINRAILGDNLQGMIDRIPSELDKSISKIFILAGSNDIDVGSKSEKIMIHYKKLIQSINLAGPETKIYVISIFPLGKSYPESLEKNQEIIKINSELQKLQTELNFNFINMHSLLKDEENYLKEIFSYDGLHLNTSGYAVLKKVLLYNL